ncbi:MAG TPA: hypothetical protein VK327_14460 [Candidatus Paceibacterota bacterium]|nr:hypothetical protein [Candidatus Paceibacterota bacterium]
MMLFERQRLLLTLLDALGGSAANTDFQKLLFAGVPSAVRRVISVEPVAPKRLSSAGATSSEYASS